MRRGLEDLAALADQPAAEGVEGVVAGAVQKNPGGCPQVPLVRAVVAGLEVPGEEHHSVRIQPRQALDEHVGLLLGVALGGLAGGIDQRPELGLVHHEHSIRLVPAQCTRTPSDAALSLPARVKSSMCGCCDHPMHPLCVHRCAERRKARQEMSGIHASVLSVRQGTHPRGIWESTT